MSSATVEQSQGEVDPTRNFLLRRRDIQGIRAFAVLLVLAYHARLPGFSGGYIGVDIFFVVSGFLITSLLIREHQTENKISLRRFYARRIRRLLPASLTAVIVTLIASRIWLEPLRLNDLSQDARAAALFATNIVFSSRESDYLQSSLPPSPLQHYWSLGVEEQFYIFYPLIVMLILKLRRNSRGLLMFAISILTAVSLVLCVALTPTMNSATFYLLPFRAWELGVGALLFFAGSTLDRLNSTTREVLGWFGVAGIVFATYIYDARTVFPGYTAVLPVVATALIIAAKDNSKIGPSRLLGLPIFQTIGSRSYSLYLWHWPILIIAVAANKNKLTDIQTGLSLLATFVIAELSFRFVEQPIHKVPKFLRNIERTLAFGAVLIVVGLAASFITAPTSAKTSQLVSSQYSETELSLFLSTAAEKTALPADLDPPLSVFESDEPEIYKIGCHDHALDIPPTCIFGDQNSNTSIALVGDSHAAQWFEPLRQIAITRNWKLQTFTRSGCTPLGINKGTLETCRAWLKNVIKDVQANDFSLVVISGYMNREDLVDESPGGFTNNMNELKTELTMNSRKVMYLADTPTPSNHIPICLSANTESIQNCNFLFETAINLQTHNILQDVWSGETSRFVNLNTWFCGEQVCPAVIGPMVVYRDISHISSVYALALTNVLLKEIDVSLKN